MFLDYKIFKVVKQTRVEFVDVTDETVDYGREPQCTLILEDTGILPTDFLAVTIYGKAALHKFKQDDMVAIEPSFSLVKRGHEYYTHISARDIKLVKELKNILL